MKQIKLNPEPSVLKQKTCSACGVTFSCGITEPDGKCWCNNYPAMFHPNPEIDCLCPSCLKEATIKKINDYVSSLSPEEALDNKAKDLPKTNTLIEDVDYYMDGGLVVFTSWYHLRRGYCCENGCRHCPYG